MKFLVTEKKSEKSLIGSGNNKVWYLRKIHSPHCDNPDKIVPTATLSIPSPQLVTIHRRAIAFAKSFVVSVLPVN